MDTIKNGKEKCYAYRYEYNRLNLAMKNEFYLEAIAICYALIEDRLTACLHHLGIITRTNDELKINKMIYPYIRRLLNKDDDYIIKIRDISVKISIIKSLLRMTEDEAKRIDASVNEYIQTIKRKRTIAKSGYMLDLYQTLDNINKKKIDDSLDSIDKWKTPRNILTHALLNKTIATTKNAKKECAESGDQLAREIDNYLVKPLKRRTKIRKKYNIQ